MSDILEALGFKQNKDSEEREQDKDKKSVSPSDIEALQAKLDRLEETTQTLRASNAALMAGTQKTDVKAPEFAEVSFEGLPDPVADPENYQKQLNARINAALRTNVEAMAGYQTDLQQQQASQASRTDGLWKEFAENHPKLAEHPDFVEVAARKVIARANTRGLDTEKYMFSASAQFIEDVAKEMEGTFGKVLEADKDGDGDEDKGEDGDNAAAASSDRTGLDIRPASKPNGKADDNPGDMIKDLHALQRAAGFY